VWQWDWQSVEIVLEREWSGEWQVNSACSGVFNEAIVCSCQMLTREECLGSRLLFEIRMMEISEVALKERQM